MYVTYEIYTSLSLSHAVSEESFEVVRDRAESDINGITFCRIHDFEKLTEHQKRCVQEATVEHMDFTSEYAEYIQNPLASYGINGVSMSWDNSKVSVINGVTTTSRTISLLRKAGLVYKGVL